MKKASPEDSQPEGQVVQYREVNTICGASPIEDSTSRERAIYIRKARKAIYPTVLTGPPLALCKPVSFSDSDASIVHFPHNDALIITMLIGNCRVSKVLVDGGSSVNVLYGGALNRMEDTPEAAWAMINHQTKSHLYGFDGNKTCFPSTISLLVRTDPYNIITEFYMVDVESPDNAILGRPWVHMMKVVPSTYH